MDDEVDRLRNLRRRALYLRALVSCCTEASPSAHAASVRASLLAWRIAKIITGHLRAHPNRAVRREPGIAERVLRLVGARSAALLLRSGPRRERRLLAELEIVKKTLDDVRALTRSPTLSDCLGRAQAHAAVLLREWQRAVVVDTPLSERAGDARENAVHRLDAVSESPYLGL